VGDVEDLEYRGSSRKLRTCEAAEDGDDHVECCIGDCFVGCTCAIGVPDLVLAEEVGVCLVEACASTGEDSNGWWEGN